MAEIDFKPGQIFETHGSHALKGVEMVGVDPSILTRFLYDVPMRTKICAGCDGTLKEVQRCMADAQALDISKGPTALSYQCAKSAMKVLGGIAEEED